MGREIKRVPLDFDWPIDQLWKGYVNPYRGQFCKPCQKKYNENCPYCQGSDEIWPSEEIKKLKEEWNRFDPPTGEGYQLWSTTSEGHPMSPVFDTPEKLATWLFESKASSFGHATCTYEQWLAFAKGPGWAPSMVVTDEEIKSGVEGFK